MAVLRNPRTGATAHLPEKLVPRYLAGGWVVVAPTHPQSAVAHIWGRIPPGPRASSLPVPSGMSIADTLAWVGNDQFKASMALSFELSRDKPRVTLVDQLRKLVATPTRGEGEEE